MTDEDDPLKNADVGETHTIRETETLYGINMGPDVFWGSDRFGHADIVDVEIIETGEDESNDIKVTWEGDITKRLPYRWDYHREPVTETEKRAVVRDKWVRRAIRAVAVVVPMGLATVVSWEVMKRATGQMTINGEAMTAPTFGEFATLAVSVLFIAALIMYGMKGGFPGRMSA